MGLRTKITLILVAALIVISTLTAVVIGWDGQRRLNELEAAESNGDLRRLLVSLDAQILQVDALLISWSNWTSLYEHAGKTNPTFARDELSTDGIRLAHIDWLWRITPDGLVVDQVEVPQPDGTLPATTALSKWGGRIGAQVSSLKDKFEGCGTIEMAGHLSFVCYRPLHDSAGGGDARGIVAIGRWIGPKVLESVKQQTDLDFELASTAPADPGAGKPRPAAGKALRALLGSGEPALVREDDRLMISFPIISLTDRHIGEVRMHWPRRSVTNARLAMEQTRNTLLLMLLATAVALIALIDRLIVKRLRRLKDELGAIVGDHNWQGVISDEGSDEIGELSRFASGLMGVLRAQLLELRELSSIDTLTSLPNRRTFDSRVTHVMAQYARTKRPASLILIDIDFFKRYNDSYGHPAGDAALQRVAECLTSTLRRQLDLAARLGGEEFAIICDETPLDGAATCAELVRKAILAAAIEHGGNQPLGVMSISLGVATIEDGDTATSLYQRADKALYLAKESGRNRVSTGH